MTKNFNVTVQTGPERFESFMIQAKTLSEAWVKGARIANSPLILTVKEVI
jgi:hypothetical protein